MRKTTAPINRLIGVALAVISAACFGTLGILGRFAYQDGMDAYTILFLRFTFAGVIMAAWLRIRREPLPRGSILLRLVGMGALGYTLQGLCYMLAVQFASPGLVALLLYLYPVLVAGLSALIFKEQIGRIKLIALGLALAGTALTVNPGGGLLTGALLAISAAVIYSVYIIVGTGVMREVSAVQSSTVIFCSAAASIGLLTAINGPRLPATHQGWLAVAGIVVFSTIIPVVTFLAALQRIGPTDTSMLSTLEPVVTVLLATLLLREGLTWLSLLGGALILASTLLVTNSELRKDKT